MLADRAGVTPEVRVVDLRAADRPAGADPNGSRDWHHRWVVRMHKVRQWYPSEQQHKILYRSQRRRSSTSWWKRASATVTISPASSSWASWSSAPSGGRGSP